jgi:uncharacterized protein YecE (DUF72 family)
LEDYASRMVMELENGKEVYAYFNNTMGEALRNLQTLNHLVYEKSKGKSQKSKI